MNNFSLLSILYGARKINMSNINIMNKIILHIHFFCALCTLDHLRHLLCYFPHLIALVTHVGVPIRCLFSARTYEEYLYASGVVLVVFLF